MDDIRTLRAAGWAGVGAVVLLVVSFVFWGMATIDPTSTDATIQNKVEGSDEQAFAQLAYLFLTPALVLLLCFVVGLRRVLRGLDGGDALAILVLPGAAVLCALLLAGFSIDLSSTIAGAWTDRFSADVNTSRALAVASAALTLGALTGAAVLVGATARIWQRRKAVPAAVVWLSYLVAVACTFALWTFGVGMLLFALWLIGAVAWYLRTIQRAPEQALADTYPEAEPRTVTSRSTRERA